MPSTLPNTLLIISLKMYFAPSRTLSYLRGLLELNANSNNSNKKDLLLALIPDFLTIHPCAEILREANATDSFLLGAQDCFWESHGPFTGEVSPLALRDLDVSIVELGHAERRAIFHETDDEVAKKAKAACKHGLIPLVCVGEITAPAGDQAKSIAWAIEEVAVQIRPVLGAIPAVAPVIFAYEPVWAIGKPVPAGVDHVSAVVEGIRGIIRESGGSGRQGEVRVLYGGSAGPGLWGAGGLGKAVDGMFLGRFAHEIDGVRKVVQEVEETL
jgi:triosephosphate isomerase